MLVVGLDLQLPGQAGRSEVVHEPEGSRQAPSGKREEPSRTAGSFGIGFGGFDAKAALFWAFVGIPLAWGVWKTLESAIKIF